ncbi:hypothetical protein B4Q13_16790 [Lacticaseibacillus rhamnosus]
MGGCSGVCVFLFVFALSLLSIPALAQSTAGRVLGTVTDPSGASVADATVVVTDTMVRHAETWMKRNIPDEAHALVADVTSAYGQLNVQGPNSGALLQRRNRNHGTDGAADAA